ncbi:MAG: hypothetical protein R3Y09_12525 [Clostridia bacterium]
MIIVAIILGIIIGNLCVGSVNTASSDHLEMFYVLCVGIVFVAHAYFFKSSRLTLKTIAKSSKRFRLISVAVAFIFTVFSFIEFTKIMDTDPSTFTLLSSAGMLASGFALLFVVALTNRGKFQNQLAASISTIPILWLVFELIVIFKDNLSNPHINEYILAIFIYTTTSLALYYFSSAFCVSDKTNHFKEYYVLSVFVCVVYAVANKAGYSSSEDIVISTTIGSCAMFNAFMFPFYLPTKPINLKKIFGKTDDSETEELSTKTEQTPTE